ncbi:hypothetical protein K7X08_009932 [Anisodus acutangulus]|uniref:Uncharacterized protein n=1 Tax=Anisodus acutangulus TaxID=402998 RepID=A0A9Q1N4N5_9SOLA|nr:hypothetical protein K7X08_009932 [Anisodus acutangulus]
MRNKLLILANVLDPPCKFEFINWCFESIFDSRKVDEIKADIKELLRLFESYNDVSPNSGVSSSSIAQLSEVCDSDNIRNESIDHFQLFKKMKATENETLLLLLKFDVIVVAGISVETVEIPFDVAGATENAEIHVLLLEFDIDVAGISAETVEIPIDVLLLACSLKAI